MSVQLPSLTQSRFVAFDRIPRDVQMEVMSSKLLERCDGYTGAWEDVPAFVVNGSHGC